MQLRLEFQFISSKHTWCTERFRKKLHHVRLHCTLLSYPIALILPWFNADHMQIGNPKGFLDSSISQDCMEEGKITVIWEKAQTETINTTFYIVCIVLSSYRYESYSIKSKCSWVE